MDETNTTLLSGAANPQTASPLFSILPAEVRHEIFTHALTDYPNLAAPYAKDTCYARPSHPAPRKQSTTLLQTCRAIYREAWHLPPLLRSQTHWIAASDRAPPEYFGNDYGLYTNFPSALSRIAALHGADKAVFGHLRLFAQTDMLELGYAANVLRLPHMRPRALTLTVRHTDWDGWEGDEPLRLGAGWLADLCAGLKECVSEVRVELESVERKRGQVDEMARMMAQRWFFRREDGEVLLADVSGASDEVRRWSGSSIWGGRRWVRDEAEGKPGRIDYYIRAVVFRSEAAVEGVGGRVSIEAKEAGERNEFDEEVLLLHLPDERPMESPDGAIIWIPVEVPGDGEADGTHGNDTDVSPGEDGEASQPQTQAQAQALGQ